MTPPHATRLLAHDRTTAGSTSGLHAATSRSPSAGPPTPGGSPTTRTPVSGGRTAVPPGSLTPWSRLAAVASGLSRSLADGGRDLATLAWPVACAGCGAPDVVLCASCLLLLTAGARHAAVAAWPDGPGVWAASAYRGVPARLVVSWKDRGRHDLTAAFGTALAGPLAACRLAAGTGTDRLSLVPVPTARRNRRRRGSDLVRDLAVAASRRTGGWPGAPPDVVPALRHVRRVRDQAELGAEARRANLHGAFGVRRQWAERVNGRAVIIVDDIVTTGATVAEAARALSAEGARPVGACCLCVTARQQGVFASTPLV
jgi:predicted amidophosphoribosyltransferase